MESKEYTKHRERWTEQNNSSRFTHYVLLQNLLCLIFCLLIVSGCDQSFQPLKENTQYYFSIYGYLDASADTQWVRVAPARKQLSTDTIPEMTVTLEEVETGNSSVMHDSLFQPANKFNYINVWTTMDIKPEHTYRLVVERLADVHWRYYYKINSDGYMRERFFRFRARNWFSEKSPGNYVGRLDPNADHINTPLPEGEVVEFERTVFVAAGGPEWNEEIPSIEDLEYALPETASNIKNGVGYMLGIVSKTIPFECQEDYP
ncbi:hypothetical protein LQ318_03755 [Aliifodinibius salicampi]|uniref:DUF4249 domain-containing protein n=1 Tax=Fodinibius salicampi TaxID=1920655 RepID=A0ABT3PVZ9_9BACT|nr:hypothetical protein [Fodinibius salicampi]MCW9712011.1 hypothetical protein [Fodinibius salicampi]